MAGSSLGLPGVAVSAGVFYVMTGAMGFGPAGCFLALGVLTVLLTVVSMTAIPGFMARFVAVILSRLVYRVRTINVEAVPPSGPVLLVANHVTRADPLLVAAAMQRRVRFVASREVFGSRALAPVFRLMGVIPAAPHDGREGAEAALEEAGRSLRDGHVVCVFAEGALTRNGNMMRFSDGWAQVVKGADCPVIPVHIGGAWGSMFSHGSGGLVSVEPRRFPHPVTVIYGDPLPASTVTTAGLRRAVSLLSARHFDAKKDSRRVLGPALVRASRRFWFRPAVADSTGRSMTHGGVLVASAALARRIDAVAGDARHVGIILPASVGAVLVNTAVSLHGRVPVNLNFTVSPDALASAVNLAEIRTVVTSRAFMAKVKGVSPAEGMVYLEDLVAGIGMVAKVSAALRALFLPADRWALPALRAGPDDAATVIFSSGSAGEPKGIVLTHHNVMSNIEGFLMVCRFAGDERMCGVLPFFHSFGFTCTLWCPLLGGFSAFYHPNPLDAATVAECVRRERLTALLATPTFLLTYMRKATRDDFGSLRLVVAGAEKLKRSVAEAFERQFGIRPLEGYGATELSPVVSLNLLDAEVDGVTQVGSKEESAGHPIPGVTVDVVDPESGSRLVPGAEGMLVVNGPGVMPGYLRNQDATRAALRDGWYVTGDLARVDEDGFIFLLGRLSRFSKVGGEMVPHVGVEEHLLRALGTLHPVLSVTSIADLRKGEQLAVLYTPEAGDAGSLWRIIRESDLPNLWKPRQENLFPVDALPTLGSGKLDLRRLKAMAEERAKVRQAGGGNAVEGDECR